MHGGCGNGVQNVRAACGMLFCRARCRGCDSGQEAGSIGWREGGQHGKTQQEGRHAGMHGICLQMDRWMKNQPCWRCRSLTVQNAGQTPLNEVDKSGGARQGWMSTYPAADTRSIGRQSAAMCAMLWRLHATIRQACGWSAIITRPSLLLSCRLAHSLTLLRGWWLAAAGSP